MSCEPSASEDDCDRHRRATPRTAHRAAPQFNECVSVARVFCNPDCLKGRTYDEHIAIRVVHDLGRGRPEQPVES